MTHPPAAAGDAGRTATTARPAVCPTCGATTRGDADWCSLCFADLRPAPAPRRSEPAAARAAAPAALVAEGGAPPPAVACPTCREPRAVDATPCPTCGAGLFDGLRTESIAHLRVPLLGDLMRFGRAARSAIALAIALTVAAAVVGLLALLG